MQTTLHVATPLGDLLLVTGLQGLLRCDFGPLQTATPITADTDACLQLAARQIAAYFRGELQTFTLPVDLSSGSDFFRTVLTTLQRVPYGTTMTYGELAALAGSPGAARAVGRVMATNPLPLIIPCHRVVGHHGALTGYSGWGGIATKEWLLQHERLNLHGCHHYAH